VDCTLKPSTAALIPRRTIEAEARTGDGTPGAGLVRTPDPKGCSMERHEYRSVPVTVTAVRIPHDPDEFAEQLVEAFGSSDGISVDTVPTTADEDGPRRIERVSMTTIQGQLATALVGEWIIREHDDPTRFYPCADEAMHRRYLVPKRRRRS
jgi:hypothetical protein